MRPIEKATVTIGQEATAIDLERFAASAAQAGRSLVVGALVTDGAGRIYVQRRSPERELFPGCWDLVGGHAESGESVETALAREIREETGWRLVQLGPVVEAVDWEAGGVARREVDLLARVEGDLADPVLEASKHTEGRWLRPAEAVVLLEGRDPDDLWVHEVVKRAFSLLGSWLGSTGAEQ